MQNKRNSSNSLQSFIPVPRSVVSDYRRGALTRSQFLAYMFMRMGINPHGVVTVSLEALRDDVSPGSKDSNYVNKLLLELRNQKRIYYPSRQGRRGSFEVHFGEIVLPGGSIQVLDPVTGLPIVRSMESPSVERESEVPPRLGHSSQKLLERKKYIGIGGLPSQKVQEVRGAYTDTHTNTENELSKAKTAYKEKVLVQTFVPSTLQEQRCLEIAKYVEESSMDYLLSVEDGHGIELLERAYGNFREAERTTEIENRAAYLNTIIQALIREKGVVIPEMPETDKQGKP